MNRALDSTVDAPVGPATAQGDGTEATVEDVLPGEAAVALGVSISIGPKFIDFLRRHEFGQQIREEGPQHHFAKQGTPTMGGLLILFAACVGFLPVAPKLFGLPEIAVPKCHCQMRFTITRAVSGFSGLVNHFASTVRRPLFPAIDAGTASAASLRMAS